MKHLILCNLLLLSQLVACGEDPANSGECVKTAGETTTTYTLDPLASEFHLYDDILWDNDTIVTLVYGEAELFIDLELNDAPFYTDRGRHDLPSLSDEGGSAFDNDRLVDHWRLDGTAIKSTTIAGKRDIELSVATRQRLTGKILLELTGTGPDDKIGLTCSFDLQRRTDLDESLDDEE